MTASRGPSPSFATRLVPGVLLLSVAGAAWSYVTGGVVHAVVTAAWDSQQSLILIREAVERAGAFAPVVYVAAVVIEVLVAPIPGAILYAPGGAIFGGWWGGTLSLAGNVIGATVAAWLAARFGSRFVASDETTRFQRFAARLRQRGLLVVALLRVNPLTSSDLVSYAAGMVGIPVWRVAVGTLIGMAPLCYAQAYASEQIFRVLPASGVIVLLLGVSYLGVVGWILTRTVRNPSVRP